MTRMYATIALLLLAVSPIDYDAAIADRAQFPVSEHGYLYYLSTSHLEGEQQSKCNAILAYVVASSSSQQVIEKATPVQLQNGLHRVDLRDLQWNWRAWIKLVNRYPYNDRPGTLPLVIRADWLITQLADTSQGTDLYSLLYGDEKINRDQFLKFWGVNTDRRSHFAIIAKGDQSLSPVVARVREVENADTNQRTSAWLTLDAAKLTRETDPLEHPSGGAKHDAEEYIVGMPKVSILTGDRGMLLAFFLSNAKGERQESAPPNIATDHTSWRRRGDIRNGAGGSCIGCHTQGLLEPGISELRQYIKGNDAGVDLYVAPKALQEQVELFRLSSSAKQIARDNEDFAAALKFTNGLDGRANSEAFRSTIDSYDNDVTLQLAARELNTQADELRLAIAYYNQSGGKISARLAGLLDGLPMPRTRWEDADGWYTAYVALKAWKAK